MGSRTRTVKLVEPAEDETFENSPLFEVSDDKTIAHILVIRTDPDEGTLGKVPPTATEMDIKRKWGGGTYQLQARDERNKPMKGGFRTITCAGDPIFESPTAEKKWRRQQGVAGDDKAAAAAAAPGGFGVSEIFALLNSQAAAASAAADRRLVEQEAAHKRDLERIRLEAENRERERKAEDERRARDQRDRDDRERREREDREDRRRKEDEANRVRDREFQVVLSQLAGKGSETSTGMLIKGIEIATKLAGDGGGPNDPLTALASGLPAILEKGKQLLPGGGAKPARAGATPAAASAAASDKTLVLEGTIGEKAVALVKHFQAIGVNPEQGLSHAFDAMLQLKPQAAAPSSPAVAPMPAEQTTQLPPAPPAAPANGTAAAKPATTGS